MIYIDIFLILTLVLSVYLIFQHRLLNAIIAEGIVSSLSAALFFILKAPDIAITQVAIGSGFLTFLFIVAVKIREKIIVVYTEESVFSYLANGKHYGIAAEILEFFAQDEGMEIEYKKMDYKDAIKAIKNGDIDILISSEKIDSNIPKIKYDESEEIVLIKNDENNYSEEKIMAFSIENIKIALQNDNIKEIKTILHSLISVRNLIKGYKIKRTGKFRNIYFYLNPYNSDLMDYLKKYVIKNKKLIKEIAAKYV